MLREWWKHWKVYNSTMQNRIFQPHSVDRAQLRLLVNLPSHKRVRLMLDARELAVGLMRGRLKRKYPDLSLAMLNLKLLEELARAR